jgi:hypothetical protein
MKKKLIWRLSNLPTVEDLKTAVEAGLLTKEDAKDMLVRSEEEVPTDQLKEVKDELKLLRDLVMKIAAEPKFAPITYPIIFERIKEVPSYPTRPWTSPWIHYCSSTGDMGKSNAMLSISNLNTIS